MKYRPLTASLPICLLLLFPCCDDSTTVEVLRPTQLVPPPPVATFSGVSFAVGNAYRWHYTKITNQGNMSLWDEIDRIVSETTIDGLRYFVFSGGKMLRSTDHAVLSFDGDSVSVYYRFDVTAGQTVPFLGSVLAVGVVDTGSVFGETQEVVTVSSQSLSAGAIDEASYSTRFGPLVINRSEPGSVTRGVLVGARLDTVNYGSYP